ncbi:MAG: ISAs1 family transposase [Gammaproteobacteria bacterium]
MSVSHSLPGSSNPEVPDDYEGADISSLLSMLGRVPDPRGPRGRRHDLVFVLAVSVVAVLAGACGFQEIARQVSDLPQSLLAKLGGKWNWFTFRYSWPSRSVIRRVLVGIDAQALDLLVGAWLSERAHRDEEGLLAIAIDGKVLRGAWTDDNGQVTLFSAMLHDEAVTIAQVGVPDGTNEITQARHLLDGVTVPGGVRVLVTSDAAHTQLETAEYIKGERNFDYLMAVKGNQPALWKAVVDTCRPLLAEAAHDVVEERDRGLIKRWSCWITDAAGIDFPYVRQVACIRRDVLDLTGAALSKEFAFAITSSPGDLCGAADVNTHTRKHWGIENKSHYVRDTVWREDANQTYTGNGPQALATLRNLALGLLRLSGVHCVKETTESICRDRNRALPFLAA